MCTQSKGNVFAFSKHGKPFLLKGNFFSFCIEENILGRPVFRYSTVQFYCAIHQYARALHRIKQSKNYKRLKCWKQKGNKNLHHIYSIGVNLLFSVLFQVTMYFVARLARSFFYKELYCNWYLPFLALANAMIYFIIIDNKSIIPSRFIHSHMPRINNKWIRWFHPLIHICHRVNKTSLEKY